jgi:ubiquinone/menaquinone biosynthesis C-methylase UbiE
MSLLEINKRYTKLAEDDCCLSCGRAIDYSEPQLGEICIDLGSGRGTDVLRLAERVGPGGFVYGIDISGGMLKKARKSAAKMGIENVRFMKSSLEKFDIHDQSVDLVISNCTINHADNKQNVWNEVYRVLKPGGRFVVSDIYSAKPVPEKYRNDPVAVSECWAGAITRTEYMDVLRIAGFTNVQVTEETKPYKKGEVYVSSFTIKGLKTKKCCCQ